jgi:hypothetical protein
MNHGDMDDAMAIFPNRQRIPGPKLTTSKTGVASAAVFRKRLIPWSLKNGEGRTLRWSRGM